MGALRVAGGVLCLMAVFALSIVCSLLGVLMVPLLLVIGPRALTRLYIIIADAYWKFAVWWGESYAGIKLNLYGDNVPLHETAFVISNHRWAIDFIIYWLLACRKGRLGCVKLFSKDWLKFIPGFGWGGYVLDFVFLKRNWADDQSRIAATFDRLKTRQLPFWLLSHVEGTRITPQKLKDSQEFSRAKGLPVMTETLMPRVRGFTATIQELRNAPGVNMVLYDTTLMFVDSKTGAIEDSKGYPVGGPSLWSLMMGRPSSIVHLHVKRYTMSELPKTEAELEAWLVESFVEKNRMLREFRITGKFPDPNPQPLAFPSMNV